MANDCLPQVSACAIRVVNLETDGVPLPGDDNMYVSDGLVSLAFAWEREDPAEIKAENACGTTLLSYKPPPSLKRGRVTITLVTPDPELSQMLSQGTVLTDGAAVGYASPRLGLISENAIGIELWAKRIRDGKLDPTFPYAWWVYPWIQNLVPGDHEHANAPFSSVFTGDAYENENWFDGPDGQWPATSDAPYQWIPTTTLPDVACGYQTLAAS